MVAVLQALLIGVILMEIAQEEREVVRNRSRWVALQVHGKHRWLSHMLSCHSLVGRLLLSIVDGTHTHGQRSASYCNRTKCRPLPRDSS